MPRLPVDGKKVIEHRITFGSKERDMIEGALSAFQFNRVATPVVAGMSDVSFVLTFGALLTYFYPEIVLPKTADSAGEVIDAIGQGIEAGQKRAAEERAATGESTLDDSTGVRDFIGRLYYNLTNPNWSFGDPDAPGVTEAWRRAFD